MPLANPNKPFSFHASALSSLFGNGTNPFPQQQGTAPGPQLNFDTNANAAPAIAPINQPQPAPSVPSAAPHGSAITPEILSGLLFGRHLGTDGLPVPTASPFGSPLSFLPADQRQGLQSLGLPQVQARAAKGMSTNLGPNLQF